MDAKFWAELKKEKAETNRSHFGRRSSGNPNVIIDCQWKGVHDDIMSVLSHAPEGCSYVRWNLVGFAIWPPSQRTNLDSCKTSQFDDPD